MFKAENKIIDRLVEAMRRRTAVVQDDARQRESHAAHSCTQKVKQREVLFTDFEAIAELKKRMGLGPDTVENWRRLWRNNPALTACDVPLPMGWVLESGNSIVGYLGNIPLLYQYEGKTLIAAATSAFAVEPAYRAWSPGLMASFYRQERVDLLLNSSAVPSVGKIARALRADPLPQEDYATVLFWVLDAYSFGKAIMQRLETNGALVEIGAIGALVALLTDGFLHRRCPRASTRYLIVDEINLRDIGEEFKDLWLRKNKETPRLFANRSPEVLRWHFDAPGSKRTTHVFSCRSRKFLLGYAIVRSQENLRNGLKTSTLDDLLVEGDDSSVTEHLLVAVYEQAKRDKSHVLEVLGFPKSIRQACLRWSPYSRKYPACPFYYRATDLTLHQKLTAEDAWYATPFDGDTTLAL